MSILSIPFRPSMLLTKSPMAIATTKLDKRAFSHSLLQLGVSKCVRDSMKPINDEIIETKQE